MLTLYLISMTLYGKLNFVIDTVQGSWLGYDLGVVLPPTNVVRLVVILDGPSTRIQ